MRQRSTVLLTLLVTLGVLLSGALTDASFSAGTGESTAAAPATHAEERDASALASKLARRRHDHSQDRKQKAHKQDRKKAGRNGAWQEFCSGPERVQLTAGEGCTHGPDPAPPGFDVAKAVSPLSAKIAAAETLALSCDGDGQSGYRVQVLYVRGSDVPSHYTRYLASIRGWTAEADAIFQTSAAATGGTRSVRFVHDAICQPTVTEVVLSPAGDGAFGTTIAELQSQGYTRTDRIYLAFVDTTAAGMCGIGTVWDDDRADGNVNWNNVGPSYSRVDAGCWSGDIAAHELMHNLGGVQLSAPNSSGGFHCIDEYDVMCYQDGPYSPPLRQDCPGILNNTRLLDCGHQDYYNTDPSAGSYLATHWNPASSVFLIGAAQPAPPPPSPPPPPTDDTPLPDKHKKDKHHKGGNHNGKHSKGKHGNKRR
jgi:hypothetical protein